MTMAEPMAAEAMAAEAMAGRRRALAPEATILTRASAHA